MHERESSAWRNTKLQNTDMAVRVRSIFPYPLIYSPITLLIIDAIPLSRARATLLVIPPPVRIFFLAEWPMDTCRTSLGIVEIIDII